MTYWIIHEYGAVPYETIVEARAAAVRMMDVNPEKYRGKAGIPIFASRGGKPEGIVYAPLYGAFMWGHKDKTYGWVKQAIYKNGKIIR